MANSGANKAGSSSVSSLDKGSKNKRKLAEPSQMNPVNLPTSLTEFPQYQQSSEKPQNPLSYLPLSDARSSRGTEVDKEEECESGEWDDPIVCALEELLSSGLNTLFRNVIKQIFECGYSEDDATKNIARHSIYCGGKDLVSNIVNDTLSALEKVKGTNSSRDEMFDNLQQMVDYTMLEMINVLRDVKTSLSIAEAMWWLLMCDLNISQACTVEGDMLSFLDSKEFLGERSSSSSPSQLRSEDQGSGTIPSNTSKSTVPRPSKSSKPGVKCSMPETLKFGSFANLPNHRNSFVTEKMLTERDSLVSMAESVEKSLSSLGEHVQNMSLTLASKERSGNGRKGWSKKELAILHQKPHCGPTEKTHRPTEKTYRTYGKGAFKSGKLASIGGLVLEKRVKPASDLSAAHPKSGSSKISRETGAATASRDGGHCASTRTPLAHPVSDSPSSLPTNGTPNALPVPNTELVASSSSKNNPDLKVVANTSLSPKIPDYCAGIPFDGTLGRYIPQNEKDELILKLVPWVPELHNELNSWTEWANQKVMQAARRLRKDQAELRALRQEKQEVEQCQKDKQILEENTVKRLSEMEFALTNATSQVERSNSTVHMLEMEHSLLKKEMEAANLRAAKSAASCREAFEREQKALKNAQSLEAQRVLLREELATEKLKVAELQQEISKAENRHNQLETRWREERMARENLLAQAAAIRNEREQLEAGAKAEEEMIKLEAEKKMSKFTEDIEKLESQLSLLKYKSDSSKIAALRGSVDGSFGGLMPDSKIKNPAMKKGSEIPGFSMGGGSSSGSSLTGGLKRERECVMCLAEEKSVVFLPCAHQVLCQKCNELHEKQGMNDCPSCRSPIQQRIQVHFAQP